MSLDEAFTVKDDRLVLDPRVAKTTWQQDVNELGDAEIFEIAYYIQDVNMDLNGNYRTDEKSFMSRFVSGKLVELLRKWVARATTRRFRGINTATKRVEELNAHERFYSHASQSFKEGTYTTGIRFISNLIKGFKEHKFAVLSQERKNLTDMEVRNLYRLGAELGYMAFGLLGSVLFASLADDEEKGSTSAALLYFQAYLFRRMYAELSFFVNPKEMLKTVDTPSVALKTISNFLDAMWQTLSGPLEEYAQGEHKGESKLFKKWSKVIPALAAMNRFDRDFEKSYNFLLRGTY